jgi:hypothetical protein
MLRRTVCLPLLITLCYAASLAQDTADDVKKLVGGGEKVWVYERFETYMGDENRCQRGESWTFYEDNRLVIKKCERGRAVVEEKRWSAERKSPIDVAVKIGDSEYLLLIAPPKPRSNRETMILRQKAVSKTGKTKDMIFSHEID